jgi:thiamine biosynthesis lipoprotein
VGFVRVENHMSTAITLAGSGIDDALADAFFTVIPELEDILSRFRPRSQISRYAAGRLPYDELDARVREVISRCEALRITTNGDFEHEPRRRDGHETAPPLDVNALAKGWIVEEAARGLRMAGAEFVVNAGGDVTASARYDGSPWRIGIQHPDERTALLGAFEVDRGAVATSGTYERGDHIRTTEGAALTSVTVVGPDLGEADALSTAVFASGGSPPDWWHEFEADHGLLTLSADNRLRWIPPTTNTDIRWTAPTTAELDLPTVD